MSIALIAAIGVLLLIAAIAIAQRSRPRITQIDRTISRKKEEGE